MIPHGQGQVHTGTPRTLTSTIGANGFYKQQATFHTQNKKQPWKCYQSVRMPMKTSGHYCQYKKYPGLDTKKQTIYLIMSRFLLKKWPHIRLATSEVLI